MARRTLRTSARDLLLIVALVLSCSRTARAGDVDAARKLFADGVKLYQQGDYDGGYLTSCRVNARAGEYIVRETRTATGFEFTAFPWDPRWGPSSGIVAQAPTEDGLRVLWTAFMTMLPPRCAYMTGGPVQDPRAPPC
jgi:hypothetical protein